MNKKHSNVIKKTTYTWLFKLSFLNVILLLIFYQGLVKRSTNELLNKVKKDIRHVASIQQETLKNISEVVDYFNGHPLMRDKNIINNNGDTLNFELEKLIESSNSISMILLYSVSDGKLISRTDLPPSAHKVVKKRFNNIKKNLKNSSKNFYESYFIGEKKFYSHFKKLNSNDDLYVYLLLNQSKYNSYIYGLKNAYNYTSQVGNFKINSKTKEVIGSIYNSKKDNTVYVKTSILEEDKNIIKLSNKDILIIDGYTRDDLFNKETSVLDEYNEALGSYLNLERVKKEESNIVKLTFLFLSLLLIVEFLLIRFTIKNIYKNKLTMKKIEVNKRKISKEINLKTQIMALISHDIKNPFTSILGFLDLHQSSKDIAKKERYFKVINSEIRKVLMASNNLLKWGELQRKSLKIKKEDFLLYSELLEIKNGKEGILNLKEIELSIRIPEYLKVNFDKVIFKISIENIITNAIKFTPKGGTIEIFIEKKECNYYLSVKDSGVGISKESLFFLETATVNSSLGTNGEIGNGIGIILTKKILSLTNGCLFIKNNIDQGTTFTIILKEQF